MNFLALLLLTLPQSLTFHLANGTVATLEFETPSQYCAVGNEERNASFTLGAREVAANVCGRNLENLSGQVFATRSVGFSIYRGEVYRDRVRFFEKYGWTMKLGNADPRDNRCPPETVGLLQVRGDYAFGDDRGVEGYCLLAK